MWCQERSNPGVLFLAQTDRDRKSLIGMLRSSGGSRQYWPDETPSCLSGGWVLFPAIKSGSARIPGLLQMIFVKRFIQPGVIVWCSVIPVVRTPFLLVAG